MAENEQCTANDAWKTKNCVCPYCRTAFPAKDLHFFYREDADEVLSPGGLGGKDVTSASARRKMGSRARNDLQTTNLVQDDQNQTQELEMWHPGQTTASNQQQFGVNGAEDVIAQKFIKSYLSNMENATFVRRGRFMKLDTQEKARSDPGYCFVYDRKEKPHEWDGDTPIHACFFDTDATPKRAIRLCPECHIDLPDAYFGCPTENIHEIALAGGTSAGKTQYLVMAMHDLQYQLSQLKLANVKVELPNWFLGRAVEKLKRQAENFNKKVDKEQELVDSSHALAATTLQQRLPFIVKVEPMQPNGSLDRDKSNVHYLIFYDIAGEFANSKQKMRALQEKQFENPKNLMLFVDTCARFKETAELHPGTKVAKNAENAENALTEVLNQLINELSVQNECEQVIAVLTKIDTVMVDRGADGIIKGNRDGLTNGMQLYTGDMSMHEGAVDMATLKRIDRELDRIQPEIRVEIMNRFQNKNLRCRLMAVSTWKINVPNTPDFGPITARFEMEPKQGMGHRMVEPLLAVMASLGILKTKNEDPESTDDERARKRSANRRA